MFNLKTLRVIVSMNPSYGGPCQGIRNSVPALRRLGIETEVLSVDPVDSEFLGMDDFPIYTVGPSRTGYSYTANLDVWLKENFHNYEAIIVHGLWQYSTYGTFKVWNKMKALNKVVPALYLMPHGMLDPYFQKAKERRFKAIRNLIFWQLFEKHVVNGVSGLLFTCEQELLLAKRTFTDYHPKEQFNVGYGIQTPPKESPEHNEAFQNVCPKVSNRRYWLFLSRIHPKKGVDLLIQAYKALKSHGADLPDLVIAGPGLDTSYGEMLIKLADRDAQIVFPGMLLGAAKWGAFYGCEAFVLPSHQENFGIAVVEALACSKPVLISKQVNIWREIEEDGAGIVAQDTLTGTITLLNAWISKGVAERVEMEKRALSTYQQKFNTETFANKLSDILLKSTS